MTTSQQLHVAIVLDRSGSMDACRQDAVGAVNAYLRQLREGAARDAEVTIILFDSEAVDTVRAAVPVTVCPELAATEYVPKAMTPLLDAVGQAVTMLDQRGTPADGRFLAIMTDGLENASKEYSSEAIASLLKARQEAGWTVVYLGADHDAWSAAESMGIASAGVAAFRKDGFMNAAFAMAAVAGRVATGERKVGFSEMERRRLRQKDDESQA